MKITKYEDWITKDISYNISIDQKDDINEFDLAESFKAQYPKQRCVISFSRIIKIEVGILIIGLNLRIDEK